MTSRRASSGLLPSTSSYTHVTLYLHILQQGLTHTATTACRHIFVMERMRPDAVGGPANEGAATVCAHQCNALYWIRS